MSERKEDFLQSAQLKYFKRKLIEEERIAKVELALSHIFFSLIDSLSKNRGT